MSESSAAERFERAIRERDAGELRSLATHRDELRAIIDAPRFTFDAPAIVAVAHGDDAEVVDALLQLGADPNARSRWWAGGFHALHVARGAVAERLLAAGAVPDACAAAHLDRAELLADMIATDPGAVHQRGGDGQTPLHFARSRQVADLLLAAGADIDARDVDHRATPAQWMLGDHDHPSRSRLALARHLVERGADTDIFLAAAVGATERARALLEAQPSLLTLRTGLGEYGERPPSSYHIYLWTIGANLTPLQAAARFNQRETLDAMLHFASPAQRLLLACHEGRRDDAFAIVRELPDLVERLDEHDRRALTDEAWTANAKAVELMLELGFDPSVPSVSGATGGSALHCAAWEGSVACVSALLRHDRGRALLDRRDQSYGGTPLDWCFHGSLHCGSPRADHAGVARLLLDAGAPAPDAAFQASAAVRAALGHS